MSPEELEETRYDPANAAIWLPKVVAAHKAKAAQIEALKEKLVEERAKILMAGEDEVAEAWEYLKDNPRFANEARQQLKAETPGVEWE